MSRLAPSPESKLPLSSVQEVVWLDQSMFPGAPIYNIGLAWEIRGEVDATLLKEAVNLVANGNDALRIVLSMEDGVARQHIQPVVDVALPVIDFSAAAEPEAQARAYMASVFAQPFDLAGELLWRSQLVRVSQSSCYWLQCYHHLVNDGFGASVAMHAVARTYNRLRSGLAPDSGGPSYCEFLEEDRAYRASPRFERDRQYWCDRYSTLPAPVTTRSSVDAAGDPVPSARVCWNMPRAFYTRLTAFGTSHNASITHLMLAAIGAYFSRTAALDEVVIGVPVHNRGGVRQKQTIGMFSSISPVGVKVGAGVTFAGLLAEVGEELRRSYRHQRFPIAHLNRSLKLAQAGRRQLYDVSLTTMNFNGDDVFGTAPTHILPMHHGVERTPLVVSIRDHHASEDVLVEFEYNCAVYGGAQVERIRDGIAAMLDAVLDDITVPVAALPVMNASERASVLTGFNDTAAPVPDRLIHQLFEAQAAKQPEAIALSFEETDLSYGELNARANQVAHHLLALGIRPDDRVALCVERGPRMLAGLLGILKAGAGYVPLDPGFPAERLAYMLGDCAPAALVSESALAAAMNVAAVPQVLLDEDGAAIAARPVSNPDVAGVTAAHLAYVIYTSGSTGLPKGVMIEHGAVVNFLTSMAAAPGIARDDVLLAVTTLSFDIAGLELYLPLANGARIVLASRDVAGDALRLAAAIDASGATVMQATPATWRMLLAGGWRGAPALKVLCGGEALPPDLAAQLLARSGALWNVYGPTETTIWSTCRRVTDIAESIGRPIANTQVYILDAHLQPVPLGATGEIYIGGAGVARGYFARPELTAQRFIADPFGAAGGRLYKTGDLGRWLDNGEIACQGRNDFQVKVRGFRIELGEIEARLLGCGGVREAVVVARRDGEAADPRLVAYLIAKEGAALEPAALRSALLAGLADYMVPSAYVVLAAFPLTPNNKIDRNALPAPDGDAVVKRAYTAPQGEVETAIAAIWQELLHLEQVGRDDDFFALGGHSLLAVQLAARLRQSLNLDMSLRQLFDHPTLAGLAAVAGLAAAGQDPIVAADRTAGLRLSFEQQRLWFLDQLDAAASAAYHMAGALRLKGTLDLDALRAALDGVVARHEILRTRFIDNDGQARQLIDAADAGFRLALHDLSGLSAPQQEHEIHATGRAEVETPFDLATGPLVRGRLLHLGASDHVLLITMHHIVSDGWSVGVMLRELSALYAGFVTDSAAPLPPLPVQYADYAAWQRGADRAALLQGQADFWKSHLAGAPALLELPTDRPRPAVHNHAAATFKFTLPAGLTEHLRACAQRHGTTLFMTLLAGYAALLARLSGQPDIVIGTPVANRPRAELENLIGFFANTLALRVRLDEAPTVAQLLAEVKANTIDAFDHQDMPFDQVVDAVQPVRAMGHSPLFQVMLSLNASSGIGQLQLPGLDVSGVEQPASATQFDLVLALTEHRDELQASLTYASALFDAATIERMAGQLQILLGALAAAGDAQQVCALPLLDSHQRDQLLNGFNDTAVSCAQDRLIHELFEERVDADPDAVALVYLQSSVSYGELNARANRLAHYLRACGVKPDDRVGICLERGIDMIVAVLAILKAGGGYVPLDASYPQDRLDHMLRDSAPVLLLTQALLASALPAAGVPLVVLDDAAEAAAIAMRPDGNPDPHVVGLDARHLAYVIYTSGSTGLPKGVLNEHRSLYNLALAQRALFEVDTASRVLQFASFSFDASVFELTMALCNGASFYLTPPDGLLPGEPLLATLRTNGITHATLPSSLVATMPDDAQLPLACLIMAGDVCPPLLAARWAAQMAVFNAYGPTESTIWASTHRCDSALLTTVPIGRPIDNARIYILDAEMNPVPPGVTGEIYIGGVGVARGYLNRPELTAQRFLNDPFVGTDGARMYRSGDLGRWLADGTIEYRGRNDFQVKIRGFRIEPGEVEARLAACAGVRDAAVLAREDRPGDRRLVAYVTSHDGVTLSPSELRSSLLAHLAEYMVPSAFVIMDALPLTSSGKVNRRALPAPGQSAVPARAYSAPHDSREAAVVRIWEELLGVSPIGRQDHFFELGGHSLMAVQVVARMRRELGVELSLRTLFDHPVVADFAQAAGGMEGHVMEAIGSADRDRALPLSYEQQRLWFLDRLDRAAGAAYHIAGGLRLKGSLNEAALQAALDGLVARHEILRTTFADIDGTPVQRIAANGTIALQRQDLRHLSGHEQECAVVRIGTDEGSERFDLAAGPLVRARLLRLAEDEHVLLVTQHHIVSDGWSTGILVREVSQLYAAFSQGRDAALPPLAIQYADYAAWQRAWLQGELLRDQARFWKDHLAGAPALLELPADHPRPAVQSHAGSHLQFTLPAGLVAQLRALSQRHGTTLFMTLLAGWGALLARLSGQDDIVIGTPVANRGRTELEGLIGFFVNTLALRVRPEGDLSVAQLLAEVKADTLGAYEHQDLPFDQVVEALQPVRSMSHSPVFQVMFSMNNTPGGTILELPGLAISAVDQPSTTTQYDLVLSLTEAGDAIDASISYATDLFERASVERIVANLQVLLAGMAADDGQALCRLPLLSQSEQVQLATFNATAAPFPHDQLIQHVFEAQARARPDAIALAGEEDLSYGALNARANRLARHLLALGVKADDRVALCMQRSADMVVALLAILKAGAGYVPLDPAYPAERLAFMLDDCAPAALLTCAALADRLPRCGAPCVLVDADAAAIAGHPGDNPDVEGLHPASLAYVIYTSGSTGRPNGVQVAHRNVLRLAVNGGFAPLAPDDCVAHCASPSFDASTWEIWGALLNGARVLLVPQPVLLDPARFSRCLVEGGVTALWLTAGLFNEYVDALAPAFARLTYLLVGGDALDPRTVRRALEREQRPRHLINGYGPTETTTFATTFPIAAVPDNASSLPIGRPIGNTQIHILDRWLQTVPVGVAGEIYIGGEGVARGYLNREALTAERFIPDPFSGVAGARLYKTGDLGRWRADGTIDYLGRSDFQVKIRGFRIELGEIEAALAKCAGVREAVVLAREDQPGEKRLVAYLIAQDGAALEPAALRAVLSASLADYMIPGAFVTLAAFPLTPNGKLDRRALPRPDMAAAVTRGYVAPQGAIETAIAAIWQDLLGLDRVGRDDHFFELGGHSLMAVQVVSRIEQTLQLELSLRTLFNHPTLADFARTAARAGRRVVEAIGSADRSRALPLSYEQQRLWVLDRLDHAAGGAYHIPAALRLKGSLNEAALQAALDGLVARHEILRTTFADVDGTPVQRIAANSTIALQRQDLRHLSGHEQECAVVRIGTDEGSERFDLAAGPLVRARLLRLAEDEHVLLVTQHHIVSDGWSTGILVREVSQLYAAFSQGRAAALPPLAIQYADYAAWQRAWLQGELLRDQARFWKDHLAGAPALLELPADHPRPAVQSHAGSHLQFTLPAGLVAQLRALSQRHGTTLFMTLLAGWGALLARLSGQDDIVIGTPVANRGRTELEGLIGFFVNTLALRVRPEGDLSVAQLLAEVKADTLGAYEHQDLPFDQVVEALQPVRSMSHSPVFQVMFSMNNTPGGTILELPGLAISAVDQPSTTTQYDLVLSLTEAGDAIDASISYATDLFERASVERIVANLQVLLAGMAADDGQALCRLPLLSQSEQVQLATFNATAAPFPHDQLIQHVFEAQARTRPDAIALAGDEDLSYGALNARANRLARHLLALGVKADDRVALCMQRSTDMVVALLAILKAGAGYVPLDPAYPAERLAFMLDDCAPAALLTCVALADRLPRCGAPCVLVDADAAAIAGHPDDNPDVEGLHPASLAYVIYTSGSTGRPNGVQVAHRNVLRLAVNGGFAPLAPDDCVAHCASPSFDASTWEIWGALLNGARVLLVPQPVLLDPARFSRCLVEGGVTALWLTAGLFNEYVDALAPAFARLTYLLVGGDALDPRTVRRALEREQRPRHLINGYGPTETTTFATTFPIAAVPDNASSLPIGRPIGNTQVHILDRWLQTVPVGVAGEIYIGGEGVARGYLNRPELTAQRFVPDPFSGVAGARLYKTGDLGRWRADGTIDYLGRSDFQVKIRGFRIELGEIEAALAKCAGVREAVVLAREDQPGEKRLVAYLIAQDGAALEPAALRAALSASLADYMIPGAFVTLAAFPLTPNGKLDRRALPRPDMAAAVTRDYAAPRGATEEAVADVWKELLGLEQVGRDDHFFELGGHSLMVVSLIEHLRRRGFTVDVRSVFAAPTLAGMAVLIGAGSNAVDAVPANLIPPGSTTIVPDMLPLVALTQAEIDGIVARVPGGAAAIQDIYPLAPLQKGILFHHLLESEGDPYLLRVVLSFDTRARLDAFLGALQRVIDRHDILRTGFLWSGLREPVQVVYRQATLPVRELDFAAQDAQQGGALDRLLDQIDPRHLRLDLQNAPLFAAHVCPDAESGEWHLALLHHHLVSDHITLEFIIAEVRGFLDGDAELPPAAPYRNFIAQTLAIDPAAQEAYFRKRLGDIDEPSAPFGLLDVRGNGAGVREAELALPDGLSALIRSAARRHGVTPAVLFHVAWAQVLGRCLDRADVVFGTVLLGRMQGSEGADRVLGMFMNTLPVRISLGEASVADAVAETYRQLGELLEHEQTSLTQAQRCSGVAAPLPLFTTLLNYRHSHQDGAGKAWEGVRAHTYEERINYPIGMAVNDLGQGFSLSAQCDGADPARMAAIFARAVDQLVQALEHDPRRPVRALDVLPPDQRGHLLSGLNDTAAPVPDRLIHQLFEAQAAKQPEAIALSFEETDLSYGELNARANQVAHHLLALGIRPDDRVALCVERGPRMLAGLLGILKAGAGYVPLDPGFPAERLAYMLGDCAPAALVSESALAAAMNVAAVPQVLLDEDGAAIAARPVSNPDVAGLTAAHLAYVIYTSGSTGLPKGVMIEHGAVVNFLTSMAAAPGIARDDVLLAVTTLSFDIAGLELYLPLANGARIVLASRDVAGDAVRLAAAIDASGATVMQATPATWRMLLAGGWRGAPALKVLCGGEALPPDLAAQLLARSGALWNVYGPTETTIWSTCRRVTDTAESIGRPIANTQVYILDAHLQPVPLGATGEIYIGGAGVARGYFARPELTAQRFIADPFGAAGGRLYKTGDLGRWLDNGEIACQGRNDFQVKVRGFRIELGEIEARLLACGGVREAVVVARRDGDAADPRLVAYLIAQDGAALEPAALRSALLAGLADYMVPSAYVVLDAFPLTPNNKIDRNALPAPDGDAVVKRAYAAPQGEVETAIAAIWQELLHLEQVGRDDDFFALGGHSLLAVQLAGRIREQCHVDAALKDMFNRPVLHQMAELVTSLQFSIFMGAQQDQLRGDLDTLSEEELLKLLEEESLSDD